MDCIKAICVGAILMIFAKNNTLILNISNQKIFKEKYYEI